MKIFENGPNIASYTQESREKFFLKKINISWSLNGHFTQMDES